MSNQKINCEVCACRHHDKKCKCCNLDEITVQPCAEKPDAHFCKNYRDK